MEHLLPPAPVAFALAAAATVPLFLLLLARGPLRVAALGLRYRVACALALAAWVAMLWARGGHLDDPAAAIDVAAGALVLGSACLAGFTVWSLLCWGFTVAMLVSLAEQQGPLTSEAWEATLGGGQGLRTLFQGRIKLLVGGGFLALEQGRLVLTPRGRFTGRVARLFARVHAFERARW